MLGRAARISTPTKPALPSVLLWRRLFSASPLCETSSPLDGVVWPDTLRELHFLTDEEFGYGYFNQPIDVAPLPRGLEVLKFSPGFNQRLDHIEWPQGLREVVLGCRFARDTTHDLSRLVWPASLRELTVPVADVTELLKLGGQGNVPFGRPRRRWNSRDKSRHDDCALCAGRREQKRIDELRQLDWVPKDCRILEAYSPLQREQGLGYYDDSCTERSSDDETDEMRDMREALNYDRGWGY